MCGDKLGNEAMVPSKFKKNMHNAHIAIYAKNWFEEKTNPSNKFTKLITVSEEAQEASYIIAKIVL